MIVWFHMLCLFVHEEFFTPEWQKNVRDIAREIIDGMVEVDNGL